MTSPDFMPASAAGSPFMTSPTLVESDGKGYPDKNMIKNTTTAKSTLQNGPAKTMAILARGDFWAKDLSASSSETTSSVDSPNIFTYPPSGTADMAYSVSPFFHFSRLLPNPREKVMTLTPSARATRK